MSGREAFRWANLTLAFVLELCALGALGYWGVRTGGGPVTKTALGIGASLGGGPAPRQTGPYTGAFPNGPWPIERWRGAGW